MLLFEEGCPLVWPVTRRRAVRWAARAAGLSAAAGFVGTAPGARATASPSLPTISFLYNWQGPWNPTAGALVAEALRNLEPKVGARIVPMINGCCGGGAGYIIPLILAGQGPDVYTGCCEDFAGFVSQGMLMNLEPYIKRDNIDPSIWSKGQYEAFTLPSGQYALPVYAGPHVLMYNQTVLDELGLMYPEDDWDYRDAVKIWSACATTKGGQHRYGAQLSWFNGYWEGPYLIKGWGGQEMNADHTVCELDSAPAVAAMTWLYELLDAGVVATRDLPINPWPLGPQTVFVTLWGGTLTATAMALRTTSDRWRYIVYPKWPVRHASDMNIDFYGINAFTKYPEQAWNLLKEISGPGTYYQRTVQMRLALTPPCLNSLWEEFLQIVYTVAPPLRNRNLEAMMQTALNGWGYTQQYFAYEPVQADQLLAGYLTKLAAKVLSPAEAMRQATRQINALEASGRALQAASLRALHAEEAEMARLQRVVPGPEARYPAPSVAGVGVPYRPAPELVVRGSGGTWTLLGDGDDVWNTSDNCVFACLPVTATEGEWTCRVVVLANLTCPHLSQWVKVGLMARGDLSDDAPHVALYVTGAHQLAWQWRGLPGYTPSASVGLLPTGVQGITAPNTKPSPNYLLAPVWLRIRRVGLQWTPFASMDGRRWTQLAPAPLIDAGGVWLGVFACAHNGSFGDRGYIRATFDQLSFAPTVSAQVGRLGVPPAAGSLPAGWATAVSVAS